MVESVTTMATTIRVIAITSLVLSRMNAQLLPAIRGGGDLLVGSIGQVAAVRAVLLQLVVQGLQADAQNLCCACLVIVRACQRAQDQLLFRFFYSCSNAEMNRVRIELCRFYLRGSESRRQVTRFDQFACREDYGAL